MKASKNELEFLNSLMHTKTLCSHPCASAEGTIIDVLTTKTRSADCANYLGQMFVKCLPQILALALTTMFNKQFSYLSVHSELLCTQIIHYTTRLDQFFRQLFNRNTDYKSSGPKWRQKHRHFLVCNVYTILLTIAVYNNTSPRIFQYLTPY